MKKIILLFLSVLVFYSCLSNDEPTLKYEFLPIDSAETPTSFTFGEIDTIKIKYTLPNGCYSFDRLYYEYQDTTRVVAITALVILDAACTQALVEEEYEFPVRVSQREDYIFKFWKGEDSNGEDIFEEVVIPVN